MSLRVSQHLSLSAYDDDVRRALFQLFIPVGNINVANKWQASYRRRRKKPTQSTYNKRKENEKFICRLLLSTGIADHADNAQQERLRESRIRYRYRSLAPFHRLQQVEWNDKINWYSLRFLHFPLLDSALAKEHFIQKGFRTNKTF